MCCWGYKDVYLEEAPPKKEEENKNEYIMVSSDMEPAPAKPNPVYSPIIMTWQWVPPIREMPPTAAAPNVWDRVREAQGEARGNAQPGPVDSNAPPQSPWDRLREAQDEAARNAQPKPLQPAPVHIPVPFPYYVVPTAHPVAVAEPEKPMPPYYYYAVQQAYIPQPVMVPTPTIIPVLGHQQYYQYQPAPAPAEPAKPEPVKLGSDPNQQYYCRELEGSWSLRTASQIMKECQPGFWQSSQSGWPVFYRQKA